MSELNSKNTTSQWSISHRPHKWEDVYGQENIVKALKKRIIDENYGKAIILEGPYGCGKTSIAEMYAAAIMAHDKDGNPDWSHPECKPVLDETFTGSVIRLDGGLDSTKSAMVDLLSDLNTKPLYTKDRVILIEEADQLSGASEKALLKTLEDPRSWNHFILLSMLDKKGISPAIKSRCQTFQVKSLDVKSLMFNLKNILEKEGLWQDSNIPDSFRLEGLSTIASISQGSMRNAVQYLEQCVINEAWTGEAIKRLINVIDEEATWRILDSLLAKDKNADVLKQIIWMKSGDEINHLYNYATMILSESLLYRETGIACDETSEPRLKKLSQSPNLDLLYECFTLPPQVNKAYLRTSDIVGILAYYYQNLDFRPKTQQERAVEQLKNMTVAYLPKTEEPIIADAFKPGFHTAPCVVPVEKTSSTEIIHNASLSNTEAEEQKIVIGTKETPDFLKPKTNAQGVKVRETKTNISNINIAF